MTAPNAELAARVDAAVRARREALIGQLGHDAVLWLALVPLWTRAAAEAAGFPARSVAEFVQRARDAGWCETRGSLRDGGAPGLRFWMPEDLRRDLVDQLRRHSGAAAREIAARVGRITQDSGAVVPGALQAWASLLILESTRTPALLLVDNVRVAVDRQDLGAAQEYVSAGEALAALLGGTMELAVDRSRRLLSLGRHRRMDARDLERYLDRQELSDAVDRLLRDEADQWALHLRGVGGVGKTMLIRYLAAGRYAAGRGQAPIPIARVDFDYMSPDYPVRRPVQLLLELADELSLHTASVGAADYALDRFRATAATAHEAFSGSRAGRAPAMEDERVLGAVSDFAGSLRRLPRVLLILDTCEELAKTGGRPGAAPAVTTTFEILERIHERAPNVRVLFAGRRPLPAHDYLSVQPVGGFTAGEARQYLTAVARPAVRGVLADAMIRQSPAPDDPDRVSPFDLALY
ncbi:MAG: hypothetical protein ACRDN0_10145, partial [Trebonia sp.]